MRREVSLPPHAPPQDGHDLYKHQLRAPIRSSVHGRRSAETEQPEMAEPGDPLVLGLEAGPRHPGSVPVSLADI